MEMAEYSAQLRTVGDDVLRWRVLVLRSGGVRLHELGGRGPDALSLSPAGRIRLTSGGSLELEVDGAAGLALLNDVQVGGTSALRAGDQVRLGDVTALVQGVSLPPKVPTFHRWSRDKFALRLAETFRSARALGFGITLFLAQPTRANREVLNGLATDVYALTPLAVFGELGPETLQICVPAQIAPRVQALLEDRRSAGALTRFGSASFPGDTFVMGGLIDRAIRRLWSLESSHEELIVQDPMMVRLQGLVDRIATDEEPVLLVGELGVGKTRWAWQLHQRSGHRNEPFRQLDCRRLGVEQLRGMLAECVDGTVLLEGVEALDPEAQDVVHREWPTRARVIATTESTSLTLKAPLGERLHRITLALPPLRDRPSEILPLALQALQQARAGIGRARMTFTADARRALQNYPWPGNVRELRNAAGLAALASESEEVRFENLPTAVQHGPASELEPGADLRSKLKAAEKDVLLKVLARTRWNVTAAARELGLPRRTVVYRMSRLGLKRPAR